MMSFVATEAPFHAPRTVLSTVYTHDIQDSEFYDAQELDTVSELTYNIDVFIDTL